MKKVSGQFDVSFTTLDSALAKQNGCLVGRRFFEKTFIGPLAAMSGGEMLNVLTSIEEAVGYVAIEDMQVGKEAGFLVFEKVSDTEVVTVAL